MTNNDDRSITISFEEIYRFNWELHGHDNYRITTVYSMIYTNVDTLNSMVDSMV